MTWDDPDSDPMADVRRAVDEVRNPSPEARQRHRDELDRWTREIAEKYEQAKAARLAGDDVPPSANPVMANSTMKGEGVIDDPIPYVFYVGTGLSDEPGGPDLGNRYRVTLRYPEGLLDRHRWRWDFGEAVVFPIFTPFPRLVRLERRVARTLDVATRTARSARERLRGSWGVLRGNLVAAEPGWDDEGWDW